MMSAVGAGLGLLANAVRMLEGPVREKLGKRPDQLAFKKAVASALAELEESYPDLAASLVDETFIREHAADLVNQYLTGTPGDEIARALAARWRDQFHNDNLAADRGVDVVAAAFEQFLDSLSSSLAGFRAGHDLLQLQAAQESKVHLRELAKAARRSSPDGVVALTEYLSWVESRNTYLDARGTFQTQRQVQLKLDEIFVELSASEQTSIDADQFAQRAAQEADVSDEPRRIDLNEVVRKHPIVAVLGDPGGGKSTLVRYLALTHARELLGQADDGDHKGGRSRIPILVRVASLVEQEDWRSVSMLKTIVSALDAAECPSVSTLEELFNPRLIAGTALVMFDGLDEVTEADDRRAVVRKIDDFIARHATAGNKFVVTSRIAGYREAALGGHVRHYVIRDMSRGQQTLFLNRWCRAVEDSQTPDVDPKERERVALREIDAISSAIETSPGVAALAVNPLLLRILALIHRTGARLPDRRVELYKLASETLAQTWRMAQGVPESALIQENVLTRVLSHLAYWMHTTQPSGTATHNELFDVLGKEWCRINNVEWDDDEANEAVAGNIEAFLARVRVQTGLFVERYPDNYGFMHLTFEEYYAARELIRKRGRAASSIRRFLHDPRWKEPILLSLGFLGLDYPDDASELVRDAILGEPDEEGDEGLGSSVWENFLHRDLSFALDCIADGIPVETGLAERIVNSVVAILMGGGLSSRQQRILWSRALTRVRDLPNLTVRPEELVLQGIFENSGGCSSELAALPFVLPAAAAIRYGLEYYENDANPTELRVAALQAAVLAENIGGEVIPFAVFASIIERQDLPFLGVALSQLPKEDPSDGLESIERVVLDQIANPDLRSSVTMALSYIRWNDKTPDAIELLVAAARGLRSDVPIDKSSAAYGLARCEPPSLTIDSLVELAKSDNPETREDAHFSLTIMYGRSAHLLPPIETMMTEEELAAIVAGYAFMLESDDDEPSEAAQQLLEFMTATSSDSARAFYIEVLADEYDPDFWWPEIFAEWSSLGPSARISLARTARQVELAYTDWLVLAQDNDPSVRAGAVASYGAVLDPGGPTDDDLRSLIADDDAAVRASALRLAPIGRWQDGRKLLADALSDESPNVRVEAWRSAVDGPSHPTLQQFLLGALGPDSVASERRAALEAAYRLDAELHEEVTARLRSITPAPISENPWEAAADLESYAYASRLVGDFDSVYTAVDQTLSVHEIYFRGPISNAVKACAMLDPVATRAAEQLLLLAQRRVSVMGVHACLEAVEDLMQASQGDRSSILELVNKVLPQLCNDDDEMISNRALACLSTLAQWT